MRRLAQLARLYGRGHRRIMDVASAAFAGAVCRVAPMLADSAWGGEGSQGSMQTHTVRVLGAGSFDEDWEDARSGVTRALASSTRGAGRLYSTLLHQQEGVDV